MGGTMTDICVLVAADIMQHFVAVFANKHTSILAFFEFAFASCAVCNQPSYRQLALGVGLRLSAHLSVLFGTAQ
jgi:hypothetical protein